MTAPAVAAIGQDVDVPTSQPAGQVETPASQPVGQDSDATASQPAAQAETKDSPEPAASATGRKEAWASSIEAPPGAADPELQRAISRLKAVRMPEPEARPSPQREIVPIPQSQPAAASQPTAAPTSQPTSQPTSLPALSKLADGDAAQAAALADALFLSKHYEQALQLYEQAAAAKVAPTEQAWLLFQAGNCHMHMDPVSAVKAYALLQQHHPDSPFAAVAEVRKQWVEWREKNDLAGLLEQVRQKDPQ